MKLNKMLKIILIVMMSLNMGYAKKEETININFKNLQINDLIKITSKIINKNILLTKNIKGKVDFISNKPIKKSEILDVLRYVLEGKGYTMIDNNGLLRIVKINEASKHNMPIITGNKKIITYQMVTEIFNVPNANVDYISAKIRHLISRSAKLVTDKTSNSIIITDFPSNIKTIKRIISILSKDSKKYIEIINLKNIDGTTILTDIKNVAKAIYDQKIEKEKVSVLLSKDNNAIMLVGKKTNVKYLSNYIKNLDKDGSLVERIVKVIYLKNAESNNIIKIINGVIASKAKKIPIKVAKKDKPYITSDDESNSIILMGAKKQIQYYEDLIAKLDTDRQQVYVQARIIEISENRTRDVGIKYGLSGYANDASYGLATFSSALNGTTPNISTLATAAVGAGIKLPASGISALGVSLNLLQKNGAANIVSEPSLLCINNKKSTIYIGNTVSIKTAKTNGTTSTESFKREDIGLTLSIKPRISNSNKVLLEISTKIEDVDTSQTNGQPNTSKKELDTSAIVNTGESVILGGYIRDSKKNQVSKIPLLGDIPLLGYLFRSNKVVKDKINLVIIITPYIVPKSKDLTYIREQLSQLRFLEDKYTKDTIIKLEKAKIEAKRENEKRKEDYKDLIEDSDDVYSNEDIEDKLDDDIFGD